MGNFQKNCNYAKTEVSIKMISRSFAANDITNIVLKFGDNRTKGREIKGGGKFVENLRKSNYAKTKVPVKMISKCFTAKVIANIVLKFGDNRLKGRGVTGGSIWRNFRKSVITQKRECQSR